jgi:hypothetical protein
MADTLFQSWAVRLGQSCLDLQPKGQLRLEDRSLVFERQLQADFFASASTECWVIQHASDPAEPFGNQPPISKR